MSDSSYTDPLTKQHKHVWKTNIYISGLEFGAVFCLRDKHVPVPICCEETCRLDVEQWLAYTGRGITTLFERV